MSAQRLGRGCGQLEDHRSGRVAADHRDDRLARTHAKGLEMNTRAS